MAWLYLFSYEIFWSAWFVILGYAYVLLKARSALNVDWVSSEASWVQKLVIAAPFSLNASWVVVASCLQVGVNALEEGWLASADFCTGVLTVAVAWACYVAFTKADFLYAAVAAWALFGIWSNQSASSTFGCASRICKKACVDSMALCSTTTKPPGRFGELCANYTPSGLDDCSAVPKSEKIRVACLIGVGCVAVALVAGIVRGLAERKSKERGGDHEDVQLSGSLVA